MEMQKILAEIQEEKPRSTNPVGSASRVLFAASNTAVLARAEEGAAGEAQVLRRELVHIKAQVVQRLVVHEFSRHVARR